MTTTSKVPFSELRCLCDPAMFDFETTADIEPLDQVIGQERAVRAITFGLEMKSAGYHIFVTGPEGTGKSTIVQEIVRKAADSLPIRPSGAWSTISTTTIAPGPCRSAPDRPPALQKASTAWSAT